jgi:hypothetical protein
MFKKSLALSATFVAVFSPCGVAAEPNEVEQLRQEIRQLKESYEARIQALERRLSNAPRDGDAARATAPPASAPLPATSGNAMSTFNPAISLILGGTYAHLSQDPASFRIQGFVPSGGEVGPGARSFNLGESELTFSASVDPYFSGRLTASLAGDNSVSVEEALFETHSLFNGATARAGRFLSSIGYLNSQHAHAWDFVDAPLAYQAFFGGPLKIDGLQLRWLAPTDRFIELGIEAGAGDAFPANRRGGNGLDSTAAFVHVGDDIGQSLSWRAGLSWLESKSRDRAYDDVNSAGGAVTNAFSGTSRTWVVDGILKWAPNGNSTRQNFKLQGEYMRRQETGTLTYDASGVALASAYQSAQSGWYLQGVYQFAPQWRLGLRHDRLDSGRPAIAALASGALTAADLPLLVHHDPSRNTLMVDYNLSEFSRLRLQFAQDKSRGDATDRQIFLQYIMSLGTHGAHSF